MTLGSKKIIQIGKNYSQKRDFQLFFSKTFVLRQAGEDDVTLGNIKQMTAGDYR